MRRCGRISCCASCPTARPDIVKLLLDTQVVLAVLGQRVDALAPFMQDALADDAHELLVSVATLWEIAIKWRLGKLALSVAPEMLPALLGAMGLQLIAIDARHVVSSAEPEPPTRDPFDRLLLTKCQVDGLTFLTADRALRAHPVALKGA